MARSIILAPHYFKTVIFMSLTFFINILFSFLVYLFTFENGGKALSKPGYFLNF